MPVWLTIALFIFHAIFVVGSCLFKLQTCWSRRFTTCSCKSAERHCSVGLHWGNVPFFRGTVPAKLKVLQFILHRSFQGLVFQLGHFTFYFEDEEICLCDPLGLSTSWAGETLCFLSGKKVLLTLSLFSLSFSPSLFHTLLLTAPLFQEKAAVAFTFFFGFLHFPFKPLVCWRDVFWRSKVVLTLLAEGKPGLSFPRHPLRQHCFLMAFLTILNHFLHTAKIKAFVLTAASSEIVFVPLFFSCRFAILYFINCPFWTLHCLHRACFIPPFLSLQYSLIMKQFDLFLVIWDAYYLFCALKNSKVS